MDNPKTLLRRGLFGPLAAVALALPAHPLWAQINDTTLVATADTTIAVSDTATTPQKHGLVARLMRYFAESDKPKANKKIDFGIIGGPHYDTDTGLGLGLVASATYSADRTDSLLERSNASLYSDVTTKAFLMIGLRGNHFFPHRRLRLDYRLYV